MRYQGKRVECAVVFCIIGIIFWVLLGSPLPGYTHGPQDPYRPGIGMGMGPGMGMGMGLQREQLPQSPPCGLNLQRGIMGEPPYCRMLLDRPDLNLTTKQREDLKKLQIDYMKESFNLRSDLQIHKIELKKLRFSKNPEFDRIKAKLETISKLQLDLQIKRVKLQLDADKILTDVQRDLLYLAPGMSVDIEWEEGEEAPEPGPSP